MELGLLVLGRRAQNSERTGLDRTVQYERTDSGGKDDENKAVGRVRAARMMDATDWGSFGGARLGREHQPLLELCTDVVPVVPGGSSGLSDWLLERGLIE